MIYSRSVELVSDYFISRGIRREGKEGREGRQALVILSICETPDFITTTSATAHQKKKLMLAFAKKKKFFGAWSECYTLNISIS